MKAIKIKDNSEISIFERELEPKDNSYPHFSFAWALERELTEMFSGYAATILGDEYKIVSIIPYNEDGWFGVRNDIATEVIKRDQEIMGTAIIVKVSNDASIIEEDEWFVDMTEDDIKMIFNILNKIKEHINNEI